MHRISAVQRRQNDRALLRRSRRSGALVLTLVLAVLTAACSSARRSGSRSSSNVITRAELTEHEMANAYEAVQRLRPNFLRSRGPVSVRDPQPAMPTVYINGVRYGEVETLRSLRVQEVEEIRFISASDATTRWGTGHTGGVIEVTLRRMQPAPDPTSA